MFAFFRDLFKSKQELEEARKRILALESEMQSLKLEMQEQERLLKQACSDLELAEKKVDGTIKGKFEQQMEALARELASPMVQLKTQQHLSAQRQIQAKDVLAVAMRMVQSIESSGIKLLGNIGELVKFDSTAHEGLNMNDGTLNEGGSARISMPGISYNERIIRKIAVISTENDTETN